MSFDLQKYLALCRKPVTQDSSCKRLGGHEGQCRDNLGEERENK